MSKPTLIDHAGLDPAQRERLLQQLEPLQMLENVIKWGLGQDPECSILEVVVQDEFCHDVVMSWKDGCFLAFDTT